MKRLFDFAAALIGLVLLSPVLGLLYLLIRLKLGTPVIFSQPRPGLKGVTFVLYKFRTMTDTRNRNGELLPDAERLTPFGAMLRNASLDELPELVNVLRGDMSLVGPRPLLVEYLPKYSREQARRHEVLPGITGWAQVNGRNDISWEDKLAMDVWYVDNRSLLLDMKILFLTVFKVLRQDGIRKQGHATTEKFTGEQDRL